MAPLYGVRPYREFAIQSLKSLNNQMIRNELKFSFDSASGRFVTLELSIWLETSNVLSVRNTIDLL